MEIELKIALPKKGPCEGQLSGRMASLCRRRLDLKKQLCSFARIPLTVLLCMVCVAALGQVAQNAMHATPEGLPSSWVDVKAYGAKGDGTTDDTAAIQAAINALVGGGTVFLPPGDFKVTSTLKKTQSFVGPSIMGAGFGKTKIMYSGAADTAAIYIQGGSGAMSGIKISGINFVGNSSTVGIEIDGQDGVFIDTCQFESNAVGVLFYNRSAGTFSEYDVVERSEFTSSVRTAIEYRRYINPQNPALSGTTSFNGSGIRFSTAHATGSPVVLICDTCQPYNAPLSMQVWSSKPGTLIQNNNRNPNLKCDFVGTLTLETLPTAVLTLADGPSPVTLFVGSIEANNPSYKLGKLMLYRHLELSPDGSFHGVPEARGLTANLTTGRTTIPTPLGFFSDGLNTTALLYVFVRASNYYYSYVFSYTHNPFGGNSSLIQLANPFSFNQAGYGPPTITTDSRDDIIISNPNFPSSGASATLTFEQLGWLNP